MNKTPESNVLIRLQDCDAFGHLNNVNYLHYFINAREDHLRTHYDLDLYAHSRTHGEAWVITQHQIAYLRPALPGEVVTIQSALIEVGDQSLRVEGAMWDTTKRQLKAVQWTTFRYINLTTKRTTRHPDAIQELLDTLVLEEAERGALDGRIRQLKQARLKAKAA